MILPQGGGLASYFYTTKTSRPQRILVDGDIDYCRILFYTYRCIGKKRHMLALFSQTGIQNSSLSPNLS